MHDVPEAVPKPWARQWAPPEVLRCVPQGSRPPSVVKINAEASRGHQGAWKREYEMIEEFPQRLVELAWTFVYGLSIGLGVFIAVLVVAVLVVVATVVIATKKSKRKTPGPFEEMRIIYGGGGYFVPPELWPEITARLDSKWPANITAFDADTGREWPFVDEPKKTEIPTETPKKSTPPS